MHYVYIKCESFLNFVSGNVETHFIESRRRALERFVQRVAKHPALGNSRALHDFLTIKDSKVNSTQPYSTAYNIALTHTHTHTHTVDC